MKKRHFLATAMLGLSSHAWAQSKKPADCKSAAGPVLLTIAGAIGKGNRGPLDPALDQMMAKQKLQFDRAQTFDYAALTALPQVRIRPTLEYDKQPHDLSGPLLSDVLAAAGAAAATELVLRALDGYALMVSLAEVRKYRFIVAVHLDGKPMPLGGLGPLWVVYDADRFPEMMTRPLSARFTLCPWGIYYIDAKA